LNRDTLYKRLKNPLLPFEFNAAVADVFDDMILRSVPMYPEIIRRQAQMIAKTGRRGIRVYDLGCSTGNLAVALFDQFPPGELSIVAADSSKPMLNIFQKRLQKFGRTGDVDLLCDDICRLKIAKADAVVINFTLQFIPPADREALLAKIYQGLVPGGMLCVSEKTVHSDKELSDLEVDFYYRFKRENGYSEMEISQKREALENVLVPETVDAHHQRLQRCGFAKIDLWLKWFNFCSWICIK
jgi:tRNA (cmo5U34)-methyltransferase